MKLLNHTLRHIEEVVIDSRGDIRAKFKAFAIPSGSLGRLEELAMIYASIKDDLNCKIKHKKIFTMAGDHGVVEEGVSVFPQQVTEQMVQNFMAGGGAIQFFSTDVGANGGVG